MWHASTITVDAVSDHSEGWIVQDDATIVCRGGKVVST